MAKRCKTTITIDELTDSLGVRRVDEVWDDLLESGSETYVYAYREALSEGMSEEDAEEFAQKAEQEEMDEVFRKYVDAIESAAEELYGQHGLSITIPTKRIEGREVQVLDKIKVEPTKTWRAAAAEIIETINGVGMFHFDSVEEFLESGPYTPCEAVMSHLHWIKEYPSVYGTRSAESMVDESMRYNNPLNNPLNRLVVTAEDEGHAKAKGRRFGRVVSVEPHADPSKFYVLVDQPAYMNNPGKASMPAKKLKNKLMR